MAKTISDDFALDVQVVLVSSLRYTWSSSATPVWTEHFWPLLRYSLGIVGVVVSWVTRGDDVQVYSIDYIQYTSNNCGLYSSWSFCCRWWWASIPCAM